jgi:hypothetical protein
LSWLAWRAWQGPRGWAGWAWLNLAGAAAVWVSYPAAFVVAGLASFLFLQGCLGRRWNLVLGAVCLGALAGASFGLHYLLAIQAQIATTSYYLDMELWQSAFPPPLGQWWRWPWWLLSTHAGEMLAYPNGGRGGRSVLTLALVLVGVASLARRGQGARLAFLLLPLPWALAAAVLGRYPYGGHIRTMVYLAPAVCALAGLGLGAVLRRCLPARRVTWGYLAVLAALGGLALGGIGLDLARPYKALRDLQIKRALVEVTDPREQADRWVFLAPVLACSGRAECDIQPGELALIYYYLGRLGQDRAAFNCPLERLDSTPPARITVLVFRHYVLPLDEAAIDHCLTGLAGRLEIGRAHV